MWAPLTSTPPPGCRRSGPESKAAFPLQGKTKKKKGRKRQEGANLRDLMMFSLFKFCLISDKYFFFNFQVFFFCFEICLL
jgi:hypothetical protein